MAIGKTNAVTIIEEGSAEKDFLVRFWDIDGTLLKEEWVNQGENATPPENPTYNSPYSVFARWNQSYENVQYPADIGALYVTEHTMVELLIDDYSGYQPTIRVNKLDDSLLTIYWGDGEISTSSATGDIEIRKPNPYQTAGKYKVVLQSGVDTLETIQNRGLFDGSAYDRNLIQVFIGNNLNSMLAGFFAFPNQSKIEVISYNPNKDQFQHRISTGDFPCLLALIIPDQVYGALSIGNLKCAKVVSLPNSGCYTITFSGVCYNIERMIFPPDNTYQSDSSLQACYKLKYTYLFETTILYQYMFRDTPNLKKIDNFPSVISTVSISCFNTSGVEMECLDLSNVSSLTSLNNFLAEAWNIKNVTFPESPSTNSFSDYSFYKTYVEKIILPDNTISVGNRGFESSMCEYIDCKYVSSFGTYCFRSLLNIKTVIFRNTSVPSFGTNCFYLFPPTGRIYVPDSALAAYKADAQLSVYASQILPLSQLIE